MRKKKQTYSLTAKERKQQRMRAAQKNAPVQSASAAENGAAQGENAPAAAKKRLWIPITGIILALVIILTAVLLLVLVPLYSSQSKYPRAVIELEDGRKLTLTIWEEECPIAASNFIFLAKIGFFTYSQGDSKGSLFYDVEEAHSFMRFGAYYDYSTNAMRQKQTDFLNGIPRSMMNVVHEGLSYEDNRTENYKFGYRLYKDNGTEKDRYREKYVISFNNNEAGDFVINMQEGNSSNFIDKSGNPLKNALVAFGQFEDEASQKVLDEIFALPKEENSGLSQAVGTYPKIRIKRITFRNLSKKKWKNFEFISYMLTALDGKSAISGWRNA